MALCFIIIIYINVNSKCNLEAETSRIKCKTSSGNQRFLAVYVELILPWLSLDECNFEVVIRKHYCEDKCMRDGFGGIYTRNPGIPVNIEPMICKYYTLQAGDYKESYMCLTKKF